MALGQGGASLFLFFLGSFNCWGRDSLDGGLIDWLHYASWSSIIGLFCSLGLLINMISMVHVLWLMQRNLKHLGNKFGPFNDNQRDREDDQDSRHND